MVLEGEEGEYRVPQRRERKKLAEEISRFSLCYALSEHRRAVDGRGRDKPHTGMDIASIKAGILADRIRAGDEVEGEAQASFFTAVYQPRAYYPPYLLGEMRAALRRGESPPDASPHYLPVSALPPLPDGTRISFLYQADKAAFEKPDFPAHVRDVFTRDYPRLPLLLPQQQEMGQGKVRFRARLLRLDRDAAYRIAGLGEEAYESFTARGLTFFLRPLEVEMAGTESSLRGSLFAELSLADGPGWERMVETVEKVVCSVVERAFPPCTRGEREEHGCYLPHSGFHVTRFRRRLFALVYDPVIVVFRAPLLLGLYLPCELTGGLDESAALFEGFVADMSSALREALGMREHLRVETAYDTRLPWAREGGDLRGPSFRML